MLDEEKKKLIEAEERYRHEIIAKVRSEMQSAVDTTIRIERNLWGKLYELFNSNLGMWLLSSVFISGGAALYQSAQHQYETKLAVQKEVLTCEFEIANRLNAMRFLLKRAKTKILRNLMKSLNAVY